MRVPRARVWRVFREFDHLSDAECVSCLRQTMLNAPRWVVWVPVCAALAAAGGLAAINLQFGTPEVVANLMAKTPAGQELVVMLWWVLGLLVVMPIAGVIGRDVVYYVNLRRAVRIADCRKCGQSLLGVPIIDTSLYGEPGKARVRCPECGKLWVLLEIGLTPRDLIPLEQRAASTDVGRKRGARPRPVGRD